jgi:hypothetical protein
MVQLRDGSLSAPLVDLILALIANANGQSTTDTSSLQSQLDAITDGIARMRGTEGVDVLGSLESGLIIQGTDDAAGISVTDTGNYFAGTDVEAALQELGAATVSNDNYTLALARGNTMYWVISPGATTSQGFGLTTTAPASVGTLSAGTLSGTDLFNQSARLLDASAAAAGSQAWYTPSNALACVRGGFKLSIRGAICDAASVANSRGFMGLRAAQTSPGNVEPDTFVDCIGLGSKAGDANLSIIHNDSSGTATMVALGASFPAQGAADIYRLDVDCDPGASTITWTVLRENTGDTATGSITTDIPTSTTLMSPQFWRNNGSTALAVRLAAMSVYLKWNMEA